MLYATSSFKFGSDLTRRSNITPQGNSGHYPVDLKAVTPSDEILRGGKEAVIKASQAHASASDVYVNGRVDNDPETGNTHTVKAMLYSKLANIPDSTLRRLANTPYEQRLDATLREIKTDLPANNNRLLE